MLLSTTACGIPPFASLKSMFKHYVFAFVFKMHVQTLFCLMLSVVWYALLQLFKLFGVFVV